MKALRDAAGVSLCRTATWRHFRNRFCKFLKFAAFGAGGAVIPT
jgi:hypothetical protein